MKRLSPLHLLRYLLLLCAVLGLAACKSPYEIVDPVDGSVHTTPPASFKVRYAKLPATVPDITLNGIVVTSFFTYGATEAVATGSALSPYLVEGKNTLQVDPPFGPKAQFTYDTTGPQVVVLNADSKDPNTITGLLNDTAGIQSMFINGVAIPFDTKGAFTGQVPTADVYSFAVVDKMGHASQTQYARLGQTNNPILGMRINQSGIDFALSAMVNILNGIDFNSMLAGTKLYDSTWKGPSGETYGADGSLDSLTMSASSFNLALGDQGNSAFSGRITTAHAKLTLRLHNGLLPPTVIKIGADIGPLDLSSNLNMQVANGVPQIALSKIQFNIGAIVLDETPAVFNSMLSPMVSGIANMIDKQVGNIISGVISAEVAKMMSQLLLDSYTVSMYGVDLNAVLKPEQLTTSNGSLLITMSGGISPAAKSINPLVGQPLGNLYTPDALPDPTSGVGDFALDINTNFINQLLASAHSVGLTQVNTVTTKATGAKTNQFGLPHDDSIGVDGDTRTLIEMQTAPQMRVSKIGNMPSTKVYMHGLKMVGDKKVNGAWVTAYRVRLNVIAEVKLSVSANNELEFRVANVPTIQITGVGVGNGPEMPNAINDEINNFAQIGVGFVLEQLTGPLTNLKLPSLMCLSMNFNQMDAVGAGKSHLDIAGTLVKTGEECNNPVQPSPKVSYGRGAGTPMVCGPNEEYDAGLCYQPCNPGYNGVGPVCWAQNGSYERGAGTVPSYGCASNQDEDAGLCYPKCNTGYHGVGPVCWSDLPNSYGRGAGTIPSLIPYACKDGKEMQDGLCYTPCNTGYHGVGPVCWLNEASYGRGVGAAMTPSCGTGSELDAGLCYPVCNTGYHGVGPVCWTNSELSYGRGAGAPIHTCEPGQELDAGLCYQPCASGFYGSGPTCWPQK